MEDENSLKAKTIGLRTIAIMEAGKGILAIMVGTGLLYLANQMWWQELVNDWLLKIDLQPEHSYTHISRWVLEEASGLSQGQLTMVTAIALLYASLRFVEAGGLWMEKPWAEWLGVISGGIYLPFEIAELIRAPSPLKFGLFLINVIVVAFLLRTRLSSAAEDELSPP